MRAVIGAVTSPDAEPVSRERLESLAASARLPHGGPPRFVKGPGFGLLCIPAVPGREPREYGERRNEPDDPPAVVVDGTLDNRVELTRSLGAAPTASTEALIVAAYRRWGAGCTRRLVGELAFILWDARERLLFASRDALGLRELFFRRHGEHTIVASQLRMLVPRPALSDLDEDYIADYLVTETSRGTSTPFRAATRLESGHWLKVREGETTSRRYWDPTMIEPSERSPAEHDDEFLARLRESVTRGLETDPRTWAELSGGLDSSSIVCLAHHVLEKGEVPRHDFATLTCVWDETPKSDERPWVESVLERYGVRNHQIPCDDLFFDDAIEAAGFFSEPQFGILCHPLCQAQNALLREHDVGALLSGSRAEAIVLTHMTPPAHLVDHLRALRLSTFLRELRRWQQGSGEPFSNLLLSFCLRPLLQPRRHVRPREDRGADEAWIDRGFARRTRLGDRARSSRARLSAAGTSALRMQIENLARTESNIPRGFFEWSCEVRYPFLYRPLVETALAIPLEQKITPGVAKPLLRRTMNGILPEKIRTRRGSRGPGAAVYKAYAKRWPSIEEIVRSSRLASMGVLDAGRFYDAAKLVRFGASPNFAVFTACLAFEYWLEAILGEPETPYTWQRAG